MTAKGRDLYALILDHTNGKVLSQKFGGPDELDRYINIYLGTSLTNYIAFDSPAELALALDQIHKTISPPGLDELPKCCRENWGVDYSSFEQIDPEEEGDPVKEIAFQFACPECAEVYELRFQHRVTFKIS